MKKYLNVLLYTSLLILSCISICLIGLTYINNYNKTTKIVKLVRGDQQIIIIGVCHVATKSYYEYLQTRLDTATVILYEGIKIDPKVVDSSSSLTNYYQETSKKTGKVYQDDVIKYNSDNNKPSNKVDKKEKQKEKEKEKEKKNTVWYNSDLSNGDLQQIFNTNKWNDVSNKKLNLYDKLFDNKIDNGIIILRNNKVILDVIYLMKTVKNITIFYGDAHRPHFISEFEKLGFKVVYVEKVKIDM